MEDRRCVVWTPSNNKSDVRPETGNVRWITVASNEEIIAPNLSPSENDGENARLLSFKSGRDRIFSYYASLMDAILPAFGEERE